MSIALLLVGTLAVFAAMLYLTLAVNEFERKTRSLGAILEKRYVIPEPKKKGALTPPAPQTIQGQGGIKIPLPGGKT